MGLAGLCLPIATFFGAAALPKLATVFVLWPAPIALPAVYLFPETIFSVALLVALSPVYLAASAGAAVPVWFGLGYLAGWITAGRPHRVLKAGVLLLAVSIFIPAAGYAVGPIIAEKFESVAQAKQQANNEKLRQARLKLWCTQELGRFNLYHEWDNESWAFRGLAESVKRCDDVFVLAEPRSLPDAADFYVSYPHQTFLGACHPTQSPEHCRTFEICGEDLCAQFR
jgi:hypothetical protein